MTLNSEFHLGENRPSWQTVAPTVVGTHDLSFMELTGGTRPECSGFWSDVEQACALLLKSGFEGLLVRLYCRSNAFHQKMSY